MPLIYILLCSDSTSWVRKLGVENSLPKFKKMPLFARQFSMTFPLEENTLVLEGCHGCQFGPVWGDPPNRLKPGIAVWTGSRGPWKLLQTAVPDPILG